MRPERMTHEEACALVEDAIVNSIQTLLYIRKRLERNHISTFGENNPLLKYPEHANLLCNINWYGAYLKGAQAMARALKDWNLMDFPQLKAVHGNHKCTVKRENPIVNKAIYDLFLSSTRNMAVCLEGLPDNVELRIHTERDKKGKVIKASAKFVKKETKYTEI